MDDMDDTELFGLTDKERKQLFKACAEDKMTAKKDWGSPYGVEWENEKTEEILQQSIRDIYKSVFKNGHLEHLGLISRLEAARITFKEKTMTSKEMLTMPKYDSARKCSKCGSWETNNGFYPSARSNTVSMEDHLLVPFPFIKQGCKECNYVRIVRPLDWTADNQAVLERYCAAVAKIEQGKAEIKAIEAELDESCP